MARYFFDVVNGHGLERDEEGKELASANDIPTHVAEIVSDITREELPGSPHATIRVTARDGVGENVFRGELGFKAEWL